MHPRGKGVDAERLGHERHAGVQPTVGNTGALPVAGQEQHLELRPCLPRRLRQLPPVHLAWQANVGEQQVDVGARVQDERRRRPVARLQNRVPAQKLAVSIVRCPPSAMASRALIEFAREATG